MDEMNDKNEKDTLSEEIARKLAENADEEIAQARREEPEVSEPEVAAEEPETAAEEPESEEEPEAAEEEPESIEDQELTPEEEAALLKKKKRSRLLNRLLLIAGILMIGYAAYSIGSLLWNYHLSNSEYDEIADEFVVINDNVVEDDSEDISEAITETTVSEEPQKIWYEQISVDLDGLQSKYPDIAAWLYQEGGTAISYPIMYSEEDSYYLHKTYKGTYAYAGSIFMETLNNRDFNDSHTIIYGHNMRNGSMFGTLKYLRKDGYMDTHGYFDIFLNDEIRRYQVFAYEVVLSDSWVYQVPFGVTDAFTDYINTIYSKSEVDTGVEVTNEDKIITLSTCYGSNTDKRFVVHAVWIDTYYYATGTTASEEAAMAEESTEAGS